MTEIEKIAYAKSFIDSLAKGINPLNGNPAAEDDVINNVRISRCLFYVSDILRQVIENEGVKSKKKSKIPPFFLSVEKRENFAFSETPISVSEINRRINALNETEDCKKLKYSSITSWLINKGFLKIVSLDDGKNAKRPTAEGGDIGIIVEKRQGSYGEYTVVLYTKEAQRFLFDNLDEIIEINNQKDEKGGENSAWSFKEDEKLVKTYMSVSSIAKAASVVNRSVEEAEERLRELGFLTE